MSQTHNRNTLMTKLVFVLMLLTVFATTGFAMWALIPLADLVRESDLIVVGTLRSATEDSEGIGKGYIHVENVIAGRAVLRDDRPLAIGDNLKIKWADNWACATGMHMSRQNQVGVWLLDVEEDGTVSAAYPGKFESLEKIDEIRRLLRQAKSKKPVQVDIYLKEAPAAAQVGEDAEAFVVDVSPFPDHSLERAGVTFLFAAGFYWLLYRSRFRIR